MPTIIKPKFIEVYRRNALPLKYSMDKEPKEDMEKFAKQLSNYGCITIRFDGNEGITEILILKEDIQNLHLIYEEKQC